MKPHRYRVEATLLILATLIMVTSETLAMILTLELLNQP